MLSVDEAARGILETLYPVLSPGTVPVRMDYGGPDIPDPTWSPLLVRPQDHLAWAAQKLLQLLGNSTDAGGAFYIVVGDVTQPWKQPAVEREKLPPAWHPANERRYWNRAALDNPNQRP